MSLPAPASPSLPLRPVAGAMASWMLATWALSALAATLLGVGAASVLGWCVASAVVVWASALFPVPPPGRHAVAAAFVGAASGGVVCAALVGDLSLGLAGRVGLESLALAAMFGPRAGTWRRALLAGWGFRFLLSGLELAIRGAFG